MFDYYDFTAAQFLDSLADRYEAKGYSVQYLPFVYSVDFFPLVAATTAVRTVEVGPDADFICTALTYIAHDGSGSGIINPRALVSIVIDNNQRSLTNIPTVLGNVYGTGPRPGAIFKPLILPANSTMTVTLTNLDTILNRNIRLSHVGVKAFLFPTS